MQLLQVSKTNQKFNKLTKRRVLSISLPAGRTCPFARDCLAWVEKDETGKRHLKTGKDAKHVCFAAANEEQYPGTYDARDRNLALIKATYKAGGVVAVAELIERSLDDKMTRKQKSGEDEILIRIHVSGDFFSLWYLDAWILVATRNPSWRLYAYTKALPLFMRRMEVIPTNFGFIASRGGTHDHLIKPSGLREARVVYSVKEAEEIGLPVDIDDSLAAYGDTDFALYIHGRQIKGSYAARAVAALKRLKRTA